MYVIFADNLNLLFLFYFPFIQKTKYVANEQMVEKSCFNKILITFLNYSIVLFNF